MEVSRARDREKYAKNRVALCAYAARYCKENPKKIRAAQNKYKRARYKSDPEFRVLCNMKSRFSLALKKNSRAGRMVVLLGCTIPELRAYLEALFVPGMTWENYGPVWHIDHKRPCASYSLEDPAQQRECFHFTNLQPLFASDNYKKSTSWG